MIATSQAASGRQIGIGPNSASSLREVGKEEKEKEGAASNNEHTNVFSKSMQSETLPCLLQNTPPRACAAMHTCQAASEHAGSAKNTH